MKNLKRALSFALAAVMLVGMMVVGASAASFNDADEIEHVDAVNTLVALGIIKGKDTGDFDPTGSVTRAEMAKMICVALNGGKDPNLSGVGLYPDTKGHWAAGYIDYCTNMGIVSGDTAGNFNPDRVVTGTEAAKMLLITLGYNAVTEKFVNDASWSLNINTIASQKDLYEDVDSLAGAPLSRDNAAQMIFNALQAEKVKYVIVGIINGNSVSQAEDNGKTILNDTFKVDEYEGNIVSIAYDEEDEEYDYEIGDMTFSSENDYSNLFMMNSKVLYKTVNNKTTVYGIFAEDSSVVATGLIDDISIKDKKIKINGTSYKFDNGDVTALSDIPAYAYNVKTDTNVAKAQASAEMKAIDNDGDGKIDFVVYAPFTVAKVTYVGRDSFKAGSTVDFDDVTVIGDIKKDDFVKITAATNTVNDTAVYEVIDTVISGKVTSTNGGDVKINGEWYTPADGVTATLGTTYKSMPVVNGFIFDSTVKSSTVAADDYAVVIKAESIVGSLAENRRAILLLTSGEKVTVDVEDDYSSLIGSLVTYEIDDDVYTLTAATDEAFDGTAKNTYDDGKIDGMTISNDAVVFMVNADGDSYKVVTGAELKKTDKITVKEAYFNKNDSTGFGTIALAYVKGSISSTSDNLYAYITGDISEILDEDDKLAYTIGIGPKDKDEVITTKHGTSIKGLEKGDLVVYKLNEDGLVTSIEKITETDAIDDGVKARYTAVVGYDDTDIKFDGDSTVYEITDDTVIMYINSDDVDVLSGGNISIADKDENDKYIKNVYVATNSDDEVVLLVVDDANEMADFNA